MQIYFFDERFLGRLLPVLSLFTMVMTVPQVLTIWLQREAGGISVLSWVSYLVAAVVWLFYGIRRRDPRIYIACIGWIVLDAGVVIGALLYR